MKRLVWILLAVVVTAFAQVPPVTLPGTHAKCSCHCDCGGTCGMPACLPPAPARTLPTANQPAKNSMAQAKLLAEPVRRTGEKFFAAFVEPAAIFAASRAPHRVTPAASAPLFAVHCSFRI